MSQRYYTAEKNLQIIIALLKEHNIHKVIASPGSANHTLVASMQGDSWFEMYSCVDERSAAYMACGLANESREPVVITCTEATASRNYLPGLTEAFYRKLPVLAITTTHGAEKVGQFIPQVLDHSQLPIDVAVYSAYIPRCYNADDEYYVGLKVNEAILELKHHGGGPVYLNVATIASRDYSCKELPVVRKIQRYTLEDELPNELPKKIVVFIGAHKPFNEKEKKAIDKFCAVNNAVVFCDHTSGYRGDYRVNYSLVASQHNYKTELYKFDLGIHIGEVSGDYFSWDVLGRSNVVWRVSEDGIIRDYSHKLEKVFEMSPSAFFDHYSKNKVPVQNHVIEKYIEECNTMQRGLAEIPFTKVWIASKLASKIPESSAVYFSILGSLRAWNFFELPQTIISSCNVGGFGIDGGTSSFVGASLANPDKIHFLITGDLAFFYDINAIGSRHIGNNVRILLVNNGDGTEFRMYWHPCSAFTKEECDKYMSAGGHFGNLSKSLIKHIAQDLGYEYLSASSKEEFNSVYDRFITPKALDKPMIFEVFTYSEDDNEAVRAARNINNNLTPLDKLKHNVSSLLPTEMKKEIKKILSE